MKSTLKHGEILHIREVYDRIYVLGLTVRVFGTVQSYEPLKSFLLIEDEGHTLLVDTKLVKPFEGKRNSVVQVIGEVDKMNDMELSYGKNNPPLNIILRARICREATLLNLSLYSRALEFRRAFEAENFT